MVPVSSELLVPVLLVGSLTPRIFLLSQGRLMINRYSALGCFRNPPSWANFSLCFEPCGVRIRA